MFRHKDTEKSAQGTVVAATLVGAAGSSDVHQAEYDFVVDVRPFDEPGFRTTIRQRVAQMHAPRVGDVVAVTFHDKDHRATLTVADDRRSEPPEKTGALGFVERRALTTAERDALEPTGIRTTATITALDTAEELRVTHSQELRITATVDPDDGEPFTATIPLFPLPFEEAPAVGDVINVVFDPADRTMVRAVALWRTGGPGAGSIPRWEVPDTCPRCGAAVDQFAQSLVAHPTCGMCHQPLPRRPVT